MSRKIKMIVQYDGSAYQGWQIQPGRPTVQGTIETAMKEVFGQAVRIHAAGRTDTGVHALAMPLHFETEHAIPIERIPTAISVNLPATIGILSAEEVDMSFDARRDAILRWYRYQICRAGLQEPLGPRAWHFRKPLDMDRVHIGLELLRGEHDFRGFRSAQCRSERTVLDLQEVSIHLADNLVAFDFKCRSFLQHMIRFLVEGLVALGHGRIDPGQLRRGLEEGVRPGVVRCAPPEGLCLMDVAYGRDEKTRILDMSPKPPSF